MKLKKVVIIGMGVIGGSIGKALIEKDMAGEVVGVCRRRSSLDRAKKERSLTSGYVNDYAAAVSGADMVFVATPVHVIKKVLSDLAAVLYPGTIVTDVGSTKKNIVGVASRFKKTFSFVGGHPLAGSEKSGVEHATPRLFEDSLCILTRASSTRDNGLRKVKRVWEAMGARVTVMSPEKHDEILAFTSHLPHAAAYSLAASQKREYYPYTASGFKDTSRIASSDPVLWSDIFLDNRKNVLGAIRRYRRALGVIERALVKRDGGELEKRLRACKKVRDEITGDS